MAANNKDMAVAGIRAWGQMASAGLRAGGQVVSSGVKAGADVFAAGAKLAGTSATAAAKAFDSLSKVAVQTMKSLTLKGGRAGGGGGGNPLQAFAGFGGGMTAGFVGFAKELGPAGKALATLTVAGMGVEKSFKSLASAALPQGMSQVNDAFGLLAGSLGQLVAPAFVMIGAGAMTLAEQITSALAPHMKSVAELFANMVPVITDVIGGLVEFTKNVLNARNEQKTGWFDKVNIGEALGDLMGQKVRGDDLDARLAKSNASMARGGPAGDLGGTDRTNPLFALEESPLAPAVKGGGDPGLAAAFTKNMDSMIKDMETKMNSTGAGWKGIADAGKQIQAQSFQSDMAQKQFDMQKQTVDTLKAVLAAIKEKNPQPAAVGP